MSDEAPHAAAPAAAPVQAAGSRRPTTLPALPCRARSRRAAWIDRGAVGAVLFAGSWYGLRSPALQRADVRLGDALRRAGNAQADRVVAGTTDLGSLYAVGAIAAVLGASGRRRAARDVLGVGALAWFASQKSKTWVRRQRPYESDGVRRLVRPPAGSSYPSGHAAVGAAVMTLMAERSSSRSGRVLLQGLAGYVAASRVYVGVHYPSDVVGGAGLGLVLSALWRGPVAGAGGVAVTASTRAVKAAGPPLARLAAAVVAGRRLRRLRRR